MNVFCYIAILARAIPYVEPEVYLVVWSNYSTYRPILSKLIMKNVLKFADGLMSRLGLGV
jgi:hypothetical protein